MDTKTIIQHLKIMLVKFEDQSTIHNVDIPMFKAAQEIMEIINTNKALPLPSSIKNRIKEIVKTTEQSGQFGGALWLDFKMHLNHFM